MRRITVLLACALCAALPVASQTIAVPTISGTSISTTVSTPGGFSVDLKLSFEEVSGLSLANLGVTVYAVDPNDPVLRARLPLNAVVPALPIILRIEPPVAGGLAFHGIATLDVHTHNLQYTSGCPLRIYSAPLGGAFEDITSSMGAGSYRAQATKGGFSEFLIVADARPLDQVIALKLGRLEQRLDDYEGAMPGSVYDDLEDRLEAVRTEVTAGSPSAAIGELDGFLDVVELNSGTSIPEVWRAARDLDNVAGYLRADALTLRFSLALKSAP